MNKLLLLSFICFLVFIRCSDVENKKDLFSEVYHVNSEKIIDESSLLDPWDIELTDSFIVVANQEGNPILETYSLNGELYNKFLTKGNGPNEMVYEGDLRKSKGNLILAYDLFRERYFLYNLEKKESTPIRILDLLPMQADSVLLFQKVIQTDELLIAESKSPKGRILLMDNQGKLIKYVFDFPEKIDPRVSDYENASLYNVSMTYCPTNKRLATVTHAAGLFDIYQVDDNDIQRVWDHNEFLPVNLEVVDFGDGARIARTKKSRYGYAAITSSNKYVYAIYSGRSFEQPNYSYGNIIRVMDWNGKRGCTISTDVDIRDIAVDNKDEYIYAIAINKNDDPEVVRFNIKKLIESF